MIKSINLLSTMPRRPPLHTIGASILAIIPNSCTRANNANGPVGSLTKRAIRLMNSTLLQLICTILYQWLAILFMADDYILAFENLVEKIFPPSNRLFDGIDRLVYDAECLPNKFDDAMDTLTLPEIVRIFSPFLANCLIISSWLISCLVSTLTLLGILKSDKKAKNDVNINILMVEHRHDASLRCKNDIPSRSSTRMETSGEKPSSYFQDDHFLDTATFSYHQGRSQDLSCLEPPHDGSSTNVPYQDKVPRFDKLEKCVDLNHPNNISPNRMKCSYKEILEKKDHVELNRPNGMKCTYKEMLEKGRKQEEEEEDIGSPAGSTISYEEKIEGGREKDEGKKSVNGSLASTPFSFNLNDPILELFEASWHLK